MRPLYKIAEEILADWERPDYTALPYIEAMLSLEKMSDKYILDDAEDIVLRFLTNAGKWRGPVARDIKKELNKMLKTHQRADRRAKLATILKDEGLVKNGSLVKRSHTKWQAVDTWPWGWTWKPDLFMYFTGYDRTGYYLIRSILGTGRGQTAAADTLHIVDSGPPARWQGKWATGEIVKGKKLKRDRPPTIFWDMPSMGSPPGYQAWLKLDAYQSGGGGSIDFGNLDHGLSKTIFSIDIGKFVPRMMVPEYRGESGYEEEHAWHDARWVFSNAWGKNIAKEMVKQARKAGIEMKRGK